MFVFLIVFSLLPCDHLVSFLTALHMCSLRVTGFDVHRFFHCSQRLLQTAFESEPSNSNWNSLRHFLAKLHLSDSSLSTYTVSSQVALRPTMHQSASSSPISLPRVSVVQLLVKLPVIICCHKTLHPPHVLLRRHSTDAFLSATSHTQTLNLHRSLLSFSSLKVREFVSVS